MCIHARNFHEKNLFLSLKETGYFLSPYHIILGTTTNVYYSRISGTGHLGVDEWMNEVPIALFR